jgi:hypothetical protein
MNEKKQLPQPEFTKLMEKVNQHLMPAFVKQLQNQPKPGQENKPA